MKIRNVLLCVHLLPIFDFERRDFILMFHLLSLSDDRKDNIELLDTVEDVSGDEVDPDYTEYMTGE